jgi:hypothetical protein
VNHSKALKRYFREPPPEIFDAARYLDAAVSAHLNGHVLLAGDLFTQALLARSNERAQRFLTLSDCF